MDSVLGHGIVGFVRENIKVALVSSALFAVFFGVILYFQYNPEVWNRLTGVHTVASFEEYDAVAEKEYWQTRLVSVGSAAMASELTALYGPIEDYRVQHTALHVLGELLYENEGLRGIAFCDDTSNYGCYHGFMGRAITERGDVHVLFPEIDAECAALNPPSTQVNCFHGVGHGVLGDLGYERSSLDEGLALCATASAPNYASSCYAGVFMEYNTRFLLHAPDIFESNPRPLGANPYDPCDSVDETYQRVCYFWQPDWWKVVNGGNFDEIGSWCAAIAAPTNRAACFAGVGKAAAWFTPRNTDRSLRICALMPTKEGNERCVTEAAATVLQRTKDDALSREVCEALENPDACFARID